MDHEFDQQPGRQPGPPPDAASQAASASSNTASADPLDTDGDGKVSASERAAGEIKQALQDLLKAVDSDGDAAISDSEAARFVEGLKQVKSVGASGGSDRAAGGRQLADADASTGASDLANQVMRLYVRASEGTDPSARAGRLSVAA